MKKIISLFILLWALYGVSVFLMPDVSNSVDTALWFPGFSESIRGTKTNLDAAITDIPSAWEFKSGAIDIKDRVVDWVEATKDTIDTIRSWAQQVEETYNDALGTYNELKWTLEWAKDKVEQIQWVVESVTQLTGTGS